MIKWLKDWCKDHLKSLKLPIKYNDTGLNVSEKDLTENQINRKLDYSVSICAYCYHEKYLESDWLRGGQYIPYHILY